MKNILIIGSGGREHALAWRCKQDDPNEKIYVTPGNGGIEQIAECWYTSNIQEILSKIDQHKIDLVIIGQEQYLAEGLVNQLESRGISVFGPSKEAAQLEASKSFAKSFTDRYSIPTAPYKIFDNYELAKKYILENKSPFVIKANGLAAGKGVSICYNQNDAIHAIDQMMVKKVFGNAGEQIIIEDLLEGEEVSFFIFSDGSSYAVMPTLQDHKRQGELDQGLNTGGMGCYSSTLLVSPSLQQKIITKIVKPTLEGMKKDGTPYKGVLYFGLMIQKEEPYLIEYNVRFGDPECQVLMMLLKSTLTEIVEACIQGKLEQTSIYWSKKSATTVVLANEGYPLEPKTGDTIQGLEEVNENDECMVFHSGTKKDHNRFITNGGRVLGVTCLGNTLLDALNQCYKNVHKIHWPNLQYRRDIGLKGLKKYHSPNKSKVQVGILLGSASDKKVAMKATKLFDQFGVSYEIIAASAHRTPQRVKQFLENLYAKNAEVIIAIAGMAAHLPGVVAADSHIPVIGVPVNVSLGGNDALYSIVQMPPGIPVATVGIDRGDNAAILALQILGTKYPEFYAVHKEYRLQMEYKVIESQKQLEEVD